MLVSLMVHRVSLGMILGVPFYVFDYGNFFGIKIACSGNLGYGVILYHSWKLFSYREVQTGGPSLWV
jgi:hypothetical protein